MCERAFGINNPTPIQLEHAGNVLMEALLTDHPEVEKLGIGSYKIRDYDVIAVVEDFKVITVTDITTEEDIARIKGGFTRCGKKTAKQSLKSRNPNKRVTKNIEREVRKTPKKQCRIKRKQPRLYNQPEIEGADY